MLDFTTFGDMLLTGISEANQRFAEMQSELRFTERKDLLEVAERDLLFEVFPAKKKTGKPKEDEPSKYKVNRCYTGNVTSPYPFVSKLA